MKFSTWDAASLVDGDRYGLLDIMRLRPGLSDDVLVDIAQARFATLRVATMPLWLEGMFARRFVLER